MASGADQEEDVVLLDALESLVRASNRALVVKGLDLPCIDRDLERCTFGWTRQGFLEQLRMNASHHPTRRDTRHRSFHELLLLDLVTTSQMNDFSVYSRQSTVIT